MSRRDTSFSNSTVGTAAPGRGSRPGEPLGTTTHGGKIVRRSISCSTTTITKGAGHESRISARRGVQDLAEAVALQQKMSELSVAQLRDPQGPAVRRRPLL